MWESGTLMHCWWEYRLMQPLWERIWRVLKRLKIKFPYDTYRYILKRTENRNLQINQEKRENENEIYEKY